MANNTFGLLGVVYSDFAAPKEFTAQSPSFLQYWNQADIIKFGDCTQLTPVPGAINGSGIVPTGYVDVQFHKNNQWTTGRLYTNQSGSTMAGLWN